MNRIDISKYNTPLYYAQTLFIAAVYFALGKLSFLDASQNSIITIVIFTAEGFALASAILYGKKVWPGIFIGQFLLAVSMDMQILPAMGIAAVNSVEAVIAVVLFEKFKLNKSLTTKRDVVGLAMLILFVLQIFSALFGNIILLSSSIITGNQFLSSFFSWWFGNSMGQLLVTPFLLYLYRDYKKINVIHFFLFGIVFMTLSFFLIKYLSNVYLLLSLLLPVLLYLSARFSLAYITFGVVVVSAVAVYLTHQNVGAFSSGILIDDIININLYILLHIVSVLLVGTLLYEQKTLEHNILMLNKELESRVQDEVAKNQRHQLLMLQQSRLAQMGEMINMIAHQWRQPLSTLSVVNLNLVMKYNMGKLDDKIIETFSTRSKTLTTKMSNIIDDFRDFFKPEKEKKIFNLSQVVENTMDLVRPVYEIENIDLQINIDDALYIDGYPGEFGQALINIINNAKDALIENQKDEKYIKIYTVKRENNAFTLMIEDNAMGIPQDIIDHIFDPYFSTKLEKKGTGIGLYMTKIIIEEHMEAQLGVENTAYGARFIIGLTQVPNI